MSWSPSLVRSVAPDGRLRVQLGHRVVDDFLEFAAGRCRPNTVLAAGFDLKTFFTIVDREPVEVETADVFAFIRAQRGHTHETVVRLAEGGSGLSSRTIARRLSSVSSMYAVLVVRGDVDQNPVPRGLSTRASRGRSVPYVPARVKNR